MPAIGRRTLFDVCLWVGWAGVLGGAARSDAEQISDALLTLSTALEERNAARFLSLVDRERFPDYSALQDSIVALTAQYEVSSSIGVLEQGRRGDGYELKLDWMLQMKPAGGGGPAQRRQQVVNCRIERFGKRWKVTALAPLSFFRPSEAAVVMKRGHA